MRTEPWVSCGSHAHQAGDVYGYDGGKGVKGRKPHILVDSQGLLLNVIVTEANGSERIAGLTLVMEYTQDHQNLELIWVDQGYQGERFVEGVKHLCQANLEVIKRKSKGFEILARRWVVERTFAWLSKNRRLVVDYEKHSERARNPNLHSYGSTHVETLG